MTAAAEWDWLQVVARLESGLELEFSIRAPNQADGDPMSPGAAHVLSKGLKPFYDPDRLFTQLLAAAG